MALVFLGLGVDCTAQLPSGTGQSAELRYYGGGEDKHQNCGKVKGAYSEGYPVPLFFSYLIAHVTITVGFVLFRVIVNSVIEKWVDV